MKSVLLICCCRKDDNSYEKVTGPLVSASRYLEKRDFQVDYNLEYFSLDKVMDNAFTNSFNTRCLNELPSIVQLYKNFKDGVSLSHNINFKFDTKKLNDKYSTKLEYDLVAFSTYDIFILYDLFILFTIKRKNPKIKTVLGGNVVIHSEEVMDFLSAMDGIDYVISGDIENSIEQVLNKEISYGKNTVYNIDMNSLEIPSFNENDLQKTNGIVSIAPLRGCNMKCAYCSTAKLKLRYPDAEFASKWILENRNAQQIYLTSPTLNARKEFFREFLNSIKQNTVPLFGWFRLEDLDEKMILDMTRCNFKEIYCGIDAVTNRLRKKFGKKKIDSKILLRNISLLIDKGIRVKVAFVRNFPLRSEVEHQLEKAFWKNIRDSYNQSQLKIRNFNFFMTTGSPIIENPKLYKTKLKYWSNPLDNLPELDKVISKIPKEFVYADEFEFKQWKDEDYYD